MDAFLEIGWHGAHTHNLGLLPGSVPATQSPDVVPINMRLFALKLFLVFSLVSVVGCAEVHTSKSAHPILNMELVEIHSKGKVVFLKGDAEILIKERSAGYQKVEVGAIAREGDILWLKPGCVVKIEFEDGSYILNEKHKEEVFIAFQLIKANNVPK